MNIGGGSVMPLFYTHVKNETRRFQSTRFVARANAKKETKVVSDEDLQLPRVVRVVAAR